MGSSSARSLLNFQKLGLSFYSSPPMSRFGSEHVPHPFPPVPPSLLNCERLKRADRPTLLFPSVWLIGTRFFVSPGVFIQTLTTSLVPLFLMQPKTDELYGALAVGQHHWTQGDKRCCWNNTERPRCFVKSSLCCCLY